MKGKYKKNLSMILACMVISSLVLFINPVVYTQTANGTSTSQLIIKPCEDPPGL